MSVTPGLPWKNTPLPSSDRSCQQVVSCCLSACLSVWLPACLSEWLSACLPSSCSLGWSVFQPMSVRMIFYLLFSYKKEGCPDPIAKNCVANRKSQFNWQYVRNTENRLTRQYCSTQIIYSKQWMHSAKITRILAMSHRKDYLSYDITERLSQLWYNRKIISAMI